MEKTKETKPILVMVKDGRSYFQLPYPGNHLVNGTVPNVCHGNSSWRWIEGVVTRIEDRYTPRQLSHWALKDALKEAVNLPETVPADTFKRFYEDDEDAPATYAFYNAVYEETEPVLTECSFQIIHDDAEPVSMIQGVRAQFPYHLSEYSEIHHLFPCMMEANWVFHHLKEAIRTALTSPERSQQYRLQVYEHSHELIVEEWVSYPWKKEQVVQPEKRRSKPYTVQVEGAWEKVLQVFGPKAASKTADAAFHVPALTGNNYEELMRRLETLKSDVLALVELRKKEWCPHCKGRGVRWKGQEPPV